MAKKTKKVLSDDEYILNELRRATTKWSGRTKCLNRGRYKAKCPTTGNEVWFRDCDICGEPNALKDGLLEVDHIVEVGPHTGDWNVTIKKLFCEQGNLQALCIPCHTKKTTVFNATLRFKRKNKEAEELL